MGISTLWGTASSDVEFLYFGGKKKKHKSVLMGVIVGDFEDNSDTGLQ